MRPKREVATNNGQTYFVTSSTVERRCFFRSANWADLFVETMYEYRPDKFDIHGFVVMEDHFHVLLSPVQSLELAVQCIKGGFSFRAKKFLGWTGEIWVKGFSDHRIRDEEDFEVHQRYIANNAASARGMERAEDHPYCSVGGRFPLDAFRRGLKPGFVGGRDGAAEAAPLQSNGALDEAAPLRSIGALAEAALLRSNGALTEAALLQSNGALAEAAPLRSNGALTEAAPLRSNIALADAAPFQSNRALDEASPFGSTSVTNGTAFSQRDRRMR